MLYKSIWLIIPIAFATILANLTAAYAWSLHQSNFSRLWVFAPNQFTYPLFVFPFGAACCFLAFYGYFWRLPATWQPGHTPGGWIARVLIQNPSFPIVAGMGLSLLAVFIIYENGTWTFDKLKPEYAARALSAISSTEHQLESLLKKEERDSQRENYIRSAREAVSVMKANKSFSITDLEKIDDWTYLQVVRDSYLPKRFEMFDRGALVLNMVQMITIFFVFSLIVIFIIVCFLEGDAFAKTCSVESLFWFKKASRSALVALIFAAAFVVFYKILNNNLMPVVGNSGITLIDYLVTVLCVVCALILIRYGMQVRIINEINWEIVRAAAPILGALLGIGLVFSVLGQLFGLDSSFTTRLLGYFMLVAVGGFTMFHEFKEYLPYL